MGFKMNSQFLRMSIAAGVIVVALAGCSNHSNSGSNFPPPGAAMASGKPTGPPPRVQDCAVMNVGSPTKYVCNGKVYTTHDLRRMRMDWEKKQAAGL
jgi:hypothetical protein